MKVVHISTSDNDGAGLCCYKIHKTMQSLGYDSKMLVRDKTQIDESVIEIGGIQRLKNSLWRLLNRLLRILHLKITDYNKILSLSQKYGFYTLPTSVIDLSKHPLVKEADIIHLHWVNFFLDYPSFFLNVDKPIVWTLHDENLFFGIAHYENTVLKEHVLEEKYCKLKFDSLNSKKNVGIVLLSKMMHDKFSSHPLIENFPKCIINNSVNYHLFNPIEKNSARKYFNIPNDYIVFAFVASYIGVERKGLKILIEALEQLNIPNSIILAIGENSSRIEYPRTISVGRIEETQILSAAFSCANYFVMPSQQEAFAQSPLEAMACGIPCIVFPVSGTEELITPENGIRCTDFTIESLCDGIKKAMNTTYESEKIRKDVVERFSPEKIADNYLSFYKRVIALS